LNIDEDAVRNWIYKNSLLYINMKYYFFFKQFF
jgi:hypothetical protein